MAMKLGGKAQLNRRTFWHSIQYHCIFFYLIRPIHILFLPRFMPRRRTRFGEVQQEKKDREVISPTSNVAKLFYEVLRSFCFFFFSFSSSNILQMVTLSLWGFHDCLWRHIAPVWGMRIYLVRTSMCSLEDRHWPIGSWHLEYSTRISIHRKQIPAGWAFPAAFP